MKLLIDIPEHIFEHAKETREDSNDKFNAMRAIAKGAPLPKRHGDLIDVNKKITVPVYDEQYEEWGEQTLTILEAVNKWSDKVITANDVIIQGEESED
jgi:hypothetical protein